MQRAIPEPFPPDSPGCRIFSAVFPISFFSGHKAIKSDTKKMRRRLELRQLGRDLRMNTTFDLTASCRTRVSDTRGVIDIMVGKLAHFVLSLRRRSTSRQPPPVLSPWIVKSVHQVARDPQRPQPSIPSLVRLLVSFARLHTSIVPGRYLDDRLASSFDWCTLP